MDGLSDFYFAFQKKIFTGCNRLSCGRCIWNTERISDFYRWGKTDFLDPLYDICGFSDGCFCFLLLWDQADRCGIFWNDCFCSSWIYGFCRVADPVLYRERSMDVLVAAGNGNSSDLWCDCSDIVQNSPCSSAKGWTDGNHQKGIFFRTSDRYCCICCQQYELCECEHAIYRQIFFWNGEYPYYGRCCRNCNFICTFDTVLWAPGEKRTGGGAECASESVCAIQAVKGKHWADQL